MMHAFGRLAQLVERLPYKQDVTGSSPVLPIPKIHPLSRLQTIARLAAIVFNR